MSKKHHHSGPRPAPESLGLPPTGVDSHAHLDLKHFGGDFETVLERAKAAGIARIGNVFLSPEAWAAGKDRFPTSPAVPDVFFLLGIHPTDSAAWTPSTADALRQAFTSDPRLRALGEIGLDYYWKDCPPELQRSVFIAQLKLAESLRRSTPNSKATDRLPIVIHSRDAFQDTLVLLREQGFSGYPLLWHCFGGTAREAELLIEEGWHISIPGPVTFPGNAALREALHAIPPSRLLLETDCPYLTPVPYRGTRNEPAYTVFTAHAVAAELRMDPAELWTLTGNNACRFFGL